MSWWTHEKNVKAKDEKLGTAKASTHH